MPSCPACNEPNSLTSKFCSACGADLDGTNSDRPTDAASGEEEAIEERLLTLLREGKKIEAIKLHREQTNCGLKEAKEYVEALAVRKGIEVKGAGCAGMLLLGFLAVAVAGCLIFGGG